MTIISQMWQGTRKQWHTVHIDTSYQINEAIYFVYREAFDEDPILYREGSYAYVMDRERSVDIDSELDFRMAEVLMKEKRGWVMAGM